MDHLNEPLRASFAPWLLYAGVELVGALSRGVLAAAGFRRHTFVHELAGAAEGGGKKTLALVREHADWWNVHTGMLDRVTELKDQVGDARVSIQRMIAYVPDEAAREAITESATRRFGYANPLIGTGPELAEHFAGLETQGVERVYAWFCDFAPTETLAGFGAEVATPLRPSA